MGLFDQSARRATQEEPLALLTRLGTLAGLNWRFVTWTETQTTPKPAERDQTADRVAVLEDLAQAGQLWLALVEFQSAHDPEKIDGLFVEAAQFRRNLRHGEDRQGKYLVLPVLVYLHGECPPAEARLDMRSPSGHGLLHAPLIWEVAEDSATETLDAFEQGKTTWGILFFVPLMAGADDPEVVTRWRDVVNRLPARNRADVGRVGILFAGLAGRGQVWRRYLEERTMTESPILNEWIEEACNQTRVELARKILLRTLRTRYAVSVPDDIAETINMQPSEDLLVEWCDQVAALPTLDEFRAYLRR